MSTNNATETSPLIQRTTPVQNYKPEIGWNITFSGLGGGSTIYHGYCLLTDSLLLNGGWWGTAISAVVVAASTFNLIRACQHQRVKPTALNEVLVVSENHEVDNDPLIEIAESVEKLFKTLKLDVGISGTHETSRQKIIRLLSSFQQNYQTLEKAAKKANEEKESLTLRVQQLDKTLQENSKTLQIQDSPIEMEFSSDKQQIQLLESQLQEALEQLQEAEETIQDNEILTQMYKNQLERLERLLNNNSNNVQSPSQKDLQEAQSIVSSLKERSAENSRATSKYSSPKSKTSSPYSKDTSARRVSFTRDLNSSFEEEKK